MAKYALYFIHKGIPPELGVLKRRREFAREHLCEIVVVISRGRLFVTSK